MKKNFVFDTNVLLNYPHALLRFEDNNIVVPITVIEELDKFKREASSLGRNAREAVRIIDRHRTMGNLSKGVPLESGGMLRVLTNLGQDPPLPFPTLGKTADGLILATALLLRKHEELPVVFVTNDTNLRLRADAVGLTAVGYEEENWVDIDELYSGRKELTVPSETIDRFEAEGLLSADGFNLVANQCIVLIDKDDPMRLALGRFHHLDSAILPLPDEGHDVYGISARNSEQAHALDLLLDDSVQIVTLVGKAGTGKTLLAMAAGMRKVAEERAYTKLVVARPIQPLGKELGFLPGVIGEKMRPWMEPVFDNLELLQRLREEQRLETASRRTARRKEARVAKQTRKKRVRAAASESLSQVLASGIIEIQPLTYIRGRSLPNQFLVIDEAQNLTPHEVKTIVTRAGEGTKVVLTGDPYQIDNPFLDSMTSGLTIVVERFKGHEIAAHITLTRGERSELAELASNVM